MNLYPAILAQMGSWNYYIVKMRMRELANEVGFASQVYEDRTLDEAIQRTLNEGRVRKEIVSFLTRRTDRFFSAVVVAALGGSPQYYPVKITDDERFQIFRDQKLDQAFGVLTFTGAQKYYALDGQHRLKAIKNLIDKTEPDAQNAPEGFADEELSVIMIVAREDDPGFLKSYRRLFSSLNRYAKPTDADTNIIMDEDDAFAILTRHLITDYHFFRWPGKQQESAKVKTKGKNLTSTDPHFTSLQTLYAMNEDLLATARRSDSGWTPEGEDIAQFKRFRPDEEYLEELYQELTSYWDALLEAIPTLKGLPTKMRIHDPEAHEDGQTDNLLFWPIGQELMTQVARRMLNHQFSGSEDMAAILRPLGSIEWRLHEPPWRYFLLTHAPETKKNPWKMRSEGRADALKVAHRLLGWLVGIDDLNEEEIDELKIDWQTSHVKRCVNRLRRLSPSTPG